MLWWMITEIWVEVAVVACHEFVLDGRVLPDGCASCGGVYGGVCSGGCDDRGGVKVGAVVMVVHAIL